MLQQQLKILSRTPHQSGLDPGRQQPPSSHTNVRRVETRKVESGTEDISWKITDAGDPPDSILWNCDWFRIVFLFSGLMISRNLHFCAINGEISLKEHPSLKFLHSSDSFSY